MTYTRKKVSYIIAELMGGDCACNYNGIDEWLPMVCDFRDLCPNPNGAECWEQYLKHIKEAKGGKR